MRGAAALTAGAMLALLVGAARPAAPAQAASSRPAVASTSTTTATPAAPQAQPSPVPPAAALSAAAVKVTITGGVEASVGHLPGRLLGSAVARNPAGRYGLLLLVAERRAAAEPIAPGASRWLLGPLSLFFFEPGTRTLETVATRLPEKVNAVAALAPRGSTGDADVLLLGEPGILYGLDPPWGGGTPSGAATRQLFAAPGLDLRSLHEERRDLPRPRLPWVPVARAGLLQLLTASREGSRDELRPTASFPLSVAAKREAWGLKLSSEPVNLLPAAVAAGSPPAGAAGAAGALRFAVGPEEQGKRRLRTLLFTTEGGTAPVEAWSLLPGDEQDVEGTYTTLNGHPTLLVTSISKIGILVKRDLRLFQLIRDRSRGGSPPAFAIHTDCAIWHRLDARFVETAGNGRQDLVLIHPEGLRGKKLRFMVYAAVDPDHLAAQPRETTVDVEAQAWFYGGDFSGDGVPDLLVRSGRRLLLYPGIAKAYRVADHPAWSFDLPARHVAPPAKGAAAGNQRKDDDRGEDEGDNADGRAARNQDARTVRLSHLVDLRGDGHSMLALSLDDGQGGTELVAVRRPQ